MCFSSLMLEKMAEGARFELAVPCGTIVFKTIAINLTLPPLQAYILKPQTGFEPASSYLKDRSSIPFKLLWHKVARMERFELSLKILEILVLPLHYTHKRLVGWVGVEPTPFLMYWFYRPAPIHHLSSHPKKKYTMVAEVGFEPTISWV